MALGDANNDIEMLAVCCFSSVAMGNASQHVKDLADYVTDSNEEMAMPQLLLSLFLTLILYDHPIYKLKRQRGREQLGYKSTKFVE